MTPDLTGSIVAFHNASELVQRAIDSFLNTDLEVRLYVVDNSGTDALRGSARDHRVDYFFNGANLGFGAGHNLALRKALALRPRYHLILNPDISFENGTLETLYAFMEREPSVGLAMPKVLSPEGEVQNLCKMRPRPFDLMARRFAPAALRPLLRRRLERYELRGLNQDQPSDVPIISGCFMFARTEALERTGGFDERFFLYLEDYDLCRRVQEGYRVVYLPGAEVRHHHTRASYKSLRPLALHTASAVKYFNKWGWRPLW